MKQERIFELEKTICNDYNNIAGIIVSKNNKKIYEKYFNDCLSESSIHVYSVTKSVTSILIGIAIDKGYIKSVDEKVLDFFPNYTVKRGEKTIYNITIRHLLTMTAPYKYKFAPYTKYFTSMDWVKSSLDLLGGKGEIGKFRYVPLLGPDILTGILTKATGQTVLDFATENLFSPLGISVSKNVIFHSKEEQFAFNKAKYVSGWVADPNGVNTAAWGLALTTEAMLKIGQLYLNKGQWNERQIVSSKWIEESTKEQSRWDIRNLSYGYLWWIGEDNGFAAMGDGGNIIYVNPNKNLVIAIASVFIPRPKDRIELIKKYIEPIFEDNSIYG